MIDGLAGRRAPAPRGKGGRKRWPCRDRIGAMPRKPRRRIIPSKAIDFCRAIHEETDGGLLRYSTIERIARRLKMGQREAIVLGGRLR